MQQTLQQSIPRIRGYTIFIRHGHRSPSENIMMHDDYQRERSLWHGLVSGGDKLRSALNASFPSAMDKLPNDPHHPHGWLTLKGMQHIEDVGEKISGHFPLIKSIPASKIDAYSTLYERTKTSTQMLLTGLLRTNLSYVSGPSLGFKTHSIKVLQRHQDPMAWYDNNPLQMKRLFAEAQNTEAFLERENSDEIMQLKKILVVHLPGINNSGNQMKKGNVTAVLPFRWMHAFDYFVCRETHGIPMIKGIEDLSESVQSHVAFRYHQYYSNMEHLSLSAVPLLQDLLRTVQGSSWSGKALLTGTETENENKEEIEVEINMSAVVEKSRDCSDSTGSLSLTVFGGHDVTLFSMLFALNADVLTTNSVDKRNLYWPPFGTSLIFEFAEISKNGKIETVIMPYLDLQPMSSNMNSGTTSSPLCVPPFSFTESDLKARIEYLQKFSGGTNIRHILEFMKRFDTPQ